MSRSGLPHRVQPVDIGVKEKDEGITERDVRSAHCNEAVHRVMRDLQQLPHRRVVRSIDDVVISTARGWGAIHGSRNRVGRIRWIAGAVAIRRCTWHIEPVVSPWGRSVLPGRADWRGACAAMAHEVLLEKVQRPGCPSAEVGVGDAPRILCPVPIVERQLGVHLPQKSFEAVHDLAVPRHELGRTMDMRGLMDLVLLEPIGHSAGRAVRARAWVKAPV